MRKVASKAPIRLAAELVLRAQIVRMFEIIDGRAFSELDQVFHPHINYARPGYELLEGYQRVLHFYQHERIIHSGQHQIEQIVIGAPHAACWGVFVGVLKDGTQVEERFADTYWFVGSQLRMRRSFFYRPAV